MAEGRSDFLRAEAYVVVLVHPDFEGVKVGDQKSLGNLFEIGFLKNTHRFIPTTSYR